MERAIASRHQTDKAVLEMLALHTQILPLPDQARCNRAVHSVCVSI
jgi:uncharacterized protein with NAD-binding domain and iron-sulfur cluster